MTAKKRFDLVVYGATGFTGQLVAAYLSRRLSSSSSSSPGGGIKWAIAGRNERKLRDVQRKCQEMSLSSYAPPCLSVSANNENAVEEMVRSTKVVLSTAGPFIKYSRSVVDACVKLGGCDYVDINGETPFVRQLLDEGYHTLAAAKGVFIVPNCGFDSVPSDLGTLFAVNTLKKASPDASVSVRRVRGYADMKGKLSGGTLETGLLMETMGFSEQLGDPFLLGGEEQRLADGRARPEDADVSDIAWSGDAQSWTAPFMMAGINTRVVRRSASLLNYGPEFSYNEAALAPSERFAKKLKRQSMTSVEKRKEMREAGFLPKPGEGPDEATRAKSMFKLDFYGEASDGSTCKCSVSGGDPGYDETAKMVSEAALLLVARKTELNRNGGVLTPAAAFGDLLIHELHNAGITFQCKGVGLPSKL